MNSIIYTVTEQVYGIGNELKVVYQGESYFEATKTHDDRVAYIRIHGPMSNFAITATYTRADGGKTSAYLEHAQISSLSHTLELVTERE